MCAFTPSKIPFAAPREWTIGSDGSLTIDGDASASFKYDTTNTALTIRDDAGEPLMNMFGSGITIGQTTALPSGFEVSATRVATTVATGAPFKVIDANSGDPFLQISRGSGAGAVGFFGATPAAQPNVGAVPTALSITAALVALGLVTSS